MVKKKDTQYALYSTRSYRKMHSRVSFAHRVSPIGVLFLVTSKLLEIEDIGAIVGQLGLYFVTVLLGLIIHGFGTLSLIFFICTRELPFKMIGKMGQVLATAFGTSSR